MRKAWQAASSPAGAVFMCALAVRGVFLWQWSATPYFSTPIVDARSHHLWALEILDGALIRHSAFYQSPFYAYLLAGLYGLFGIRLEAVYAVQAVAGAGAVLAIFWVARRLFGEAEAVAAGLLAAAYKPLILYTGLLLKESWIVLGLALSCLAMLRARESRRGRDAALCGLALGWTALSKGNVLLLAPIVPWCWRAAGGEGRWPRLAAAFSAGLAAAVLPATLHNAVAARDFVLVNYTTGFSAYVGNNPEARGTTGYPAGVSSSPEREEAQSRSAAEAAAGRPLKPSAVSRYWLGRCLAFIAEQPGRWLGLTAKKFALFWNWYELPDNYMTAFIERHGPPLLAWPLPTFRLVATLGLAGVFLLWRESPEARATALLAAAYAATVVLTFVSERYRLPIVAFLLPFAGAAAAAALRGRVRRLGAAALWAAPLLILVNAPMTIYDERDESQGWQELAYVHHLRGEPAKTLECFMRAVGASVEGLDRTGFAIAGAAAERLGDLDRARLIYDAGLEKFPRSGSLTRLRFLLEARSRAAPSVEKARRQPQGPPGGGLAVPGGH